MTLDSDFVHLDACVGRSWMPRWQRACLDLVCRVLGHNLWRPGSVRDNPAGSLPVRAAYCRRCFKSGYVQGDYHFGERGR